VSLEGGFELWSNACRDFGGKLNQTWNTKTGMRVIGFAIKTRKKIVKKEVSDQVKKFTAKVPLGGESECEFAFQ